MATKNKTTSLNSDQKQNDLSTLSFDDLVKGVLTVKKADIDNHFKKPKGSKLKSDDMKEPHEGSKAKKK